MRAEIRAQLGQHGLRARGYRPPVDQAAPPRMRVGEQVLGNGQVLEHQAFLVYHADAEVACLRRIRNPGDLAVEMNVAGVGW